MLYRVNKHKSIGLGASGDGAGVFHHCAASLYTKTHNSSFVKYHSKSILEYTYKKIYHVIFEMVNNMKAFRKLGLNPIFCSYSSFP